MPQSFSNQVVVSCLERAAIDSLKPLPDLQPVGVLQVSGGKPAEGNPSAGPFQPETSIPQPVYECPLHQQRASSVSRETAQ